MKDFMEPFIAVLMHTNLSDTSVDYIAEKMWDNEVMTDQMVAFIKANPEATETQLLKEAQRIAAK